jgi:hypothetical protein
MHKTVFLSILLVPVFYISIVAQNRLTWDLKAPATEMINEVSLEMQDWTGKSLYKDSIPLVGSRNDIPLPAVKIVEQNSSASIYGNGNDVVVDVNSGMFEKGLLEIFDITGRRMFNREMNVSQGKNSCDIEKLTPGIYIVKYSSRSVSSSAKVVAGIDGSISGGNFKGGGSVLGDLESRMDNQLKSANANQLKMIVSHPRLLTDTFLVEYSSFMKLVATLYPRPTLNFRATGLSSERGEYGEKIAESEWKALSGLDVMIAGKLYGKTDLNGRFSTRPDLTGNVKVDIRDLLEKYYSQWNVVNLAAGATTNLKGRLIEKYIDEHGKELLRALWDIGAYKNNEHTNFIKTSFPDSILNKKGVWVDPKYKDGSHNNSLYDINQQIAKFHFYGLPKLFEADSLNSYIYVHFGGTLAQGQTTRTYRTNNEGKLYKSRTDIYYNKDRADYDQPGILYAVLEHEFDRVYFAFLEFAEKYYVMYPDAISRLGTGLGPENSPLEEKLGALALALTDTYFYNNYLLTSTIEFPGYTGTKSASIASPIIYSGNNSGLKSAKIDLDPKNIKQLEQIFSGADKIEMGKDKLGNFITVTYHHKN